MSEPVVVAIDGPSASGKSTVSRLVAKALGYLYVDSGAMYRAITWKVLREGFDVNDREQVVALVHRVKLDFEIVEGAARMRVDGVDPGEAVRAPEVAERVSIVAAVPEVRQVLVAQQRSLTRFGSLVMEGRDIGSVVFPETPFKFYLDADPQVRAQRRAKDYAAMQIATDPNRVAQALAQRDRLDSSRAVAPLQIALGAVVINNSNLTPEQTAQIILDHIRQAGVRRGAMTVTGRQGGGCR
ncbi:MAG: (d)CMP kinase [Verrucomicrobiae bacterium]|nr:(d)CMP kinase [Verrucomicrobiae bacterium]MDW8342956.1 (d)CMP kinase [Verrucomicrobiae bacterium]